MPSSGTVIGIGFADNAFADGLGGLSAAAFLVFIPMAVLALVGVGIAFLLRASGRTRGAQVLGIVNAVIGIVLVSFGASTLDRSVLQALNPWWSSDAAVITTLGLSIIVANLLFFVRRWSGKLVIVAAVPLFLAVQCVGTPGRSIYFDHDPFDGRGETIVRLGKHHAEWNERILHSAEELRCCGSYQALVEQQADDRYRVDIAVENRDPRFAATGQSSWRERSKWAYRYPWQPSHVVEILTSDAELLDEDWQASGAMLLDAIGIQDDPDWVQRLIQRGVDVAYEDARLGTPLSYALLSRNLRLARLLIDAGADPNQRLSSGDTVLHQIVRSQPAAGPREVQFLLQMGADPTAEDDLGATPLDAAERATTRIYGRDEREQRDMLQVFEMLRGAVKE